MRTSFKMAYVRQPSPQPYLLGKVVTRKDIGCLYKDITTQTENAQNAVAPDVKKDTLPVQCKQQPVNQPLRPVRKRKRPIRYRDSAHASSVQSASDSGTFYKVKRVLGQRPKGGTTEYLVHFAGEPAQNAIWTPWGDLNSKTQNLVKSNPPPVLQ